MHYGVFALRVRTNLCIRAHRSSYGLQPGPDVVVERRRQALDSARERQEGVYRSRRFGPGIRRMSPARGFEAHEAPLESIVRLRSLPLQTIGDVVDPFRELA